MERLALVICRIHLFDVGLWQQQVLGARGILFLDLCYNFISGYVYRHFHPFLSAKAGGDPTY